MTQNQLKWAELQENIRSHLINESQAAAELKESIRHSMATESETARHYLATETETQRSNFIKEAEEHRSNLARETETERSNRAKESENYRSNSAREAETNRANLVSERYEAGKLLETAYSRMETERHNQAVESEANRHNLETELVADWNARTAGLNALNTKADSDAKRPGYAAQSEKSKMETEFYPIQTLLDWAKAGSQIYSNIEDAKKTETDRKIQVLKQVWNTIQNVRQGAN